MFEADLPVRAHEAASAAYGLSGEEERVLDPSVVSVQLVVLGLGAAVGDAHGSDGRPSAGRAFDGVVGQDAPVEDALAGRLRVGQDAQVGVGAHDLADHADRPHGHEAARIGPCPCARPVPLHEAPQHGDAGHVGRGIPGHGVDGVAYAGHARRVSEQHVLVGDAGEERPVRVPGGGRARDAGTAVLVFDHARMYASRGGRGRTGMAPAFTIL